MTTQKKLKRTRGQVVNKSAAKYKQERGKQKHDRETGRRQKVNKTYKNKTKQDSAKTKRDRVHNKHDHHLKK